MRMMDWNVEFTRRGAIWVHSGNPKKPHALLTSGLHSDGFVNCTKVMQDPAFVSLFMSKDCTPSIADYLHGASSSGWVIGSAVGAVTFAYVVAEKLGYKAGYTEKDGDSMKLARFEIGKDEKVLVVEDTITSGGTTLKTLEAIRKAGVPDENVYPKIVCIVNRSGAPEIADKEICELLYLNIKTWEAGVCPLCAQGSIAVRPKSHWADLVA